MMLPFPLSSCSFLFSTRRQRLRVSDPGNLLVDTVWGVGGYTVEQTRLGIPHIHVRQLGFYLGMWMSVHLSSY